MKRTRIEPHMYDDNQLIPFCFEIIIEISREKDENKYFEEKNNILERISQAAKYLSDFIIYYYDVRKMNRENAC